jgi:hypothetical protein
MLAVPFGDQQPFLTDSPLHDALLCSNLSFLELNSDSCGDSAAPPFAWGLASLTALVLRWADLSAVPDQLQLPAAQGLTLLNCTPVAGGTVRQPLLQLPALTSLAICGINSIQELRLGGLPSGALAQLASLQLKTCNLRSLPPVLSSMRLRTLLLPNNQLRDLGSNCTWLSSIRWGLWMRPVRL